MSVFISGSAVPYCCRERSASNLEFTKNKRHSTFIDITSFEARNFCFSKTNTKLGIRVLFRRKT